MGRSICIICEKEKKGIPIKEDRVLGVIRAIKDRLGIAKHNKLYVCESCWPKYKEKRKKFEKSMMIWGVIAGVIAIALIAASIFTTGLSDVFALLKNIIIAVMVFVIIMVLIGLGYVPSTEYSLGEKPRKKAGTAKPKKKTKKARKSKKR